MEPVIRGHVIRFHVGQGFEVQLSPKGMQNYQTKKNAVCFCFRSRDKTDQLEGKGEATRKLVDITSKLPQS